VHLDVRSSVERVEEREDPGWVDVLLDGRAPRQRSWHKRKSRGSRHRPPPTGWRADQAGSGGVRMREHHSASPNRLFEPHAAGLAELGGTTLAQFTGEDNLWTDAARSPVVTRRSNSSMR
jgi:hypothetical protein